MTLNSYRSLCDDFYVDMYINTELELPNQRDTILTFFERIQKQFPSMGRFFRRGNNEYCLEESGDLSQYRWVGLEANRIGSGLVNPSSFEDAYRQHRLIIELVPYMLGVSHLDIGSLDVTLAMDFDYAGNHDEIIAEALFGTGAFGCLLDMPSARAIGFSPEVVVALSDDESLQYRLSVESKNSVFEPEQDRRHSDNAITLSTTVRQYPRADQDELGHALRQFDALKSFQNNCRLAEELLAEKIVPNFAQPLAETIAQRRLT